MVKMFHKRKECLKICKTKNGNLFTDDDFQKFQENLMVLEPKRKTGTYDEADYTSDKTYRMLSKLGVVKKIQGDTIRKDPSKYMVYLPFPQMNQIHDLLKYGQKIIYIHSSHFPEPTDGEGIDMLKKTPPIGGTQEVNISNLGEEEKI
jgi:hypothetical protein